MKRVLLLNMPFYTLHHPALGISLLKAGLERAGFPCDILYLNLAFIERVCRQQARFSESLGAFTTYLALGSRMLSDWLFAADLFGERPEEPTCRVEEFLASGADLLGPDDPPSLVDPDAGS